MATLFISSEKLKIETALNESVDDNLLHPYILRAQDTKILPILGTDLYDDLKSHIDAGSVASHNATLLNTYIAPTLVQFAFAELLPVLRLRFVNNSIQIQQSEQGVAATYGDIKPIMNNAVDAAQFYRQRCIDYLEFNSSLFPKYTTNSGADMSPTSKNYYAGLNLNNNISTSNSMRSLLQGISDKCL
tara:strand:- start:2657 stop:3220 length:564 start_codon:yes stop_codon:yes gene_type:complete